MNLGATLLSTDEELQRLPSTIELPSGNDLILDAASTSHPFPRFISAGSRGDWSKCKRKFYERKVRRIAGGHTSIDLHAGKCFATGMEAWREVTYGHSFPLNDPITSAGASLVKQWGTYEAPASSAKQLPRVLDAIAKTVARWPKDKDWLVPIKSKSSEHAIEWPFAIPLPIEHPEGGPIYYVGVVDMAAHDRSGLVWVEDDKTTSQLGEYWKQRWRMSSAQQGYVWALKQYGLDVHGYVIRGTQIAKTKIECDELIEVVPDYRVEEWHDRMLQDIEQMVESYDFLPLEIYLNQPSPEERLTIMQRAFPQGGIESGACGDFGGCPYIDVCQARDPERMRRMLYTQLNEGQPMFEDLTNG